MKKQIGRLIAMLGRHVSEFRFALRMTVAALLTYAVVIGLGLPQGFWAVITAVLVVQANLGGSIKVAIDRFVGTLSGAVVGVVAMMTIAHTSTQAQVASIVLALLPLGFVAAMKPNMRVAPLTALIVMLVASHSDPVSSAIERVIEIFIGDVVGVSVALFFLPARASNQLAEAIGKLLGELGELTGLLRRGMAGEAVAGRVHMQHVTLRSLLKKIDDVADAAKRERYHHVSSGPEPEPLVRTANRVRNDLITLGRVVNSAPAGQGRIPVATLASAADAVMVEAEVFLRETGKRLTSRLPSASLDGFSKALDLFKVERASVRRGAQAAGVSPETAATLSVLIFCFEQFATDARDLKARVDEWAGVVVEDD